MIPPRRRPSDRRRAAHRPSPGPSRRLWSPIAWLIAATLAFTACSPAVSPSPAASSPASIPPQASPSASPAASGPSAAPSPSPSSSVEVGALASEIAAQVSSLRGLSLDRPLKPEVVSEQRAIDILKDEAHAQDPPAHVAAEEGLYERLGLLARDTSLESLEFELLGSQLLGFYLPKAGTLYVIARSGGVGPTERYTMAHEITHALQYQHVDLLKISPDALDQTDRTLGKHALIEGDALLAGTLWGTQHLTASDLAAIVTAGMDPSQQAVLAKLPPIVKEPEMFLYSQGLQLVLQLYRSGGWGAVDKALAAPPASTEQVLHPEKYAAREAPRPVALPAGLAAKLGGGWKLDLEDTMGELELGILLRSVKSSATLASDAAAGWGGDRVAYLAGPDGADAVVLRTTWDTKADADQFLDAAGRLVADGASPGTVIRESDHDVLVIVASDSLLVDRVAKAAGYPR